jgi:N-acetylglutamate synthase-like GNAT family acetyltransferase
VGFVMATLTSGEFGFSEITALMDSIAVPPARQRHGTGKRLIEALVAESTSRGARDMYTLVNWNSWELLKFFDSLQFGLAQTILLHRRIGETGKDQP